MSQTARTDQTVKKRPRESDTVETDNPLSPPSDKARLWSKYEKEGQRVAKPPIKRGKSSDPRDASPELLQSPPPPSDSAVPPPAPPKKPAAAAARIKAANKPGLKEGILNPFSDRAFFSVVVMLLVMVAVVTVVVVVAVVIVVMVMDIVVCNCSRSLGS